MNFTTGSALLELCKGESLSIGQVMLRRESSVSQRSEEDLFQQMARSYEIMKQSAKGAFSPLSSPLGGLIGGESAKLNAYVQSHIPVCGPVVARAISYAMGVLEVNASMGLIVAAPTAGSSGVIPGVYLAVQEEFSLEDRDMTSALFTAGAVGYLITRNATVAGAEGGCQAEVGSACAMAAAGVVQLMGGSPSQSLDAASIAFANILGLVCDPIRGLVESPCQTRNAMGASNALISAQIALAGVKAQIPFDEMIQVMYNVGKSLPPSLRETALGGMAAAPSACKHCAGGCGD